MQQTKKYDLEERTFLFARKVRSFSRIIPKSVENVDDIKQLIRSSGSIGANYIEANEALSRKDFYYRIKICCNESKETRYCLKLLFINPNAHDLETMRNELIDESTELLKIFSSILSNSKSN